MKERHLRRAIFVLLGFTLLLIWQAVLEFHSNEPHAEARLAQPEYLPSSKIKPNVSKAAIKTNETETNSSSGLHRPFFILHVGPPKTATTTIQCSLESISGALAKNHGYYFVGKRCPHKNETMANGETGIPGHHLMMGLINANPNSRGFEKLKERMDFHRANGNNMIFSLEAMSNHLEDKPKTWELFLSLFEGWNVRVVVAYRHYFDWIRSMYFQQHIGKKYREKWPHQGGLEHPPFSEYLSYHLERWSTGNPSNDGNSWGQHLTLYALKYFSQHFEDVRVFNLHQEGELLTNFICQMLPGLEKVCEALRNGEHQSFELKRESHSFDSSRLAMAAYKAGILDKNVSRAKAVEQTSQYLSTALHQLNESHYDCLSTDLEKSLLNASLWFQDKIATAQQSRIPKFDEAREQHEDLFRNAKASYKLCEIDPATVLRNEDWKNFFAAIHPRRKKK